MLKSLPPRTWLVAIAMVAGLACSSEDRRDQNYGTDLGVGWVPADGSAYVPRDAGPDASGDVGEVGEVGEVGDGLAATNQDAGGDAAVIDAAGGTD
jgi:hypothetical protein